MDRFLLLANAALGTDQATLTDSQPLIYVELQNGTTKVWASGDLVKRFCIMVGATVGRPIIATPYMDARPRVRVMKQALPVAGTKQVIFTKFAAKGDSTMGSSNYDEWNVTVDVRGGLDQFGNEYQGRTYTVQGQYPTETDLYNALAAQINTNTVYQDVTASVTGTGGTLGLYITTTDNYANASLNVGAYHLPYLNTVVPQTVTVSESTPLTIASGDVADAMRYNRRMQASLGNFYQVDKELPQISDPSITAGSTFKSLYMYIEDVHHTSAIQAQGNEVFARTVIFMPNAATTNYTNLIAALEEILAGTFVTSAF